MDRLKNYESRYFHFKDELLQELEEQKHDVLKYLDGEIFDIVINKKNYQIFQIVELVELKNKIKLINGTELKAKAIEALKLEGIDERAIGSDRKIKKIIESEIDIIYNNVIHNYSIEKELEKKGFIDIVYNEQGYKIAPRRFGRPTEEEKETRLNVRLTGNQSNKLRKYADEHKVKLSEAIRMIIDKL